MTGSKAKEQSRRSSGKLPALVVLTGILGGLGPVVFRPLIKASQRLIYVQSGDLSEIEPSISPWRVLLGVGIGDVSEALNTPLGKSGSKR